MIEELYQRWLNHPHIDPQLKKELAGMSEKEKQDAFYTNIEFGTAGMRGLLGAGTNRINIHTIRKAKALPDILKAADRKRCSGAWQSVMTTVTCPASSPVNRRQS